MEKCKVIFVLGPPGSGKGTQCRKIEKKFGFIHLNAGDLLREEMRKEGSECREMIEQHMREGKIVPTEITLGLIEKTMFSSSGTQCTKIGFLIDGFPLNKENLDGWLTRMSEKTDLLFVLHLKAPSEICVQRCLNRGQARIDDNDEESVSRRIVTYNVHTLPIIEHYKCLDLVKEVNCCSSKTPDEIFASISDHFAALEIMGMK